MKLEVGMYVRTKSGLIAKYIGFEKDEELEFSKYKFDGKIYWYYEYYNDCVYEEDFEEWFEEKVVKASHNIIDLIEVGDYVNGLRVMKSSRGLFVENYYVDGSGCDISRLNIKTIVTKEQFESMSYLLEKESDK